MSASATEPQRLGPYRLAQRIGEGGMGVVHLAVGPEGDLVALKVLRPWLVGTGTGRARVAREVSTLQRVRGPRIAEVLDADVTGDPPYVVTRYIPGPSLDKIVADHGPLRDAALERLAHGLAEALATVHAAGVVHRDVKPGNVVIFDGQPVLIDFGLARALDETRLTATGMVIGTPGYLAPETVEGRPPSPQTDVHGWGATVAFAATGRPPYGTGPDAVVLDRIRRGEYDLAGVSQPLRDVLARALATDPQHRPTIGEVQQALAPPAQPDPPPARLAVAVDATEVDATLPVGRVVPPTRVDLSPAPVSTASVSPPRQVAPPPVTPYAAPPGSAVPAQPKPAVRSAPARGPVVATMFALGALLVAIGLAAPYVGLGVLTLLLIAARTSWRIQLRLYERRMARGPQRSDGVVTAVATPLHAVLSAIPSAFQVAFLAVAGVAAGYATTAVLSGPRAPLVVAGIVVVLLAWFGPGARRVRRGAEVLLRPLGRNPKAGWSVAGVLVAAAWVAGMWWESYGTSGWPYQWPPLP